MSAGRARLQVLAAALLFSTGGAGIKVAAFSGLQVSALRSGIAAIALLVLVRGRIVWSLPVVLAGIVYAATLTLFVLSTKLTTAANAIFLQSTAPLYLLLLGPLLLNEHFKRRDVIYLVAVALGMFSCFMGRPDATVTAPDPGHGNLLALMCSITWALTLVALRYVERDHSRPGLGMSAVAAGNLFASIAALPFALPLPAASTGEWITIVYLGVCQIGLAYVCLTAGIRHLPALDVSLLLLVEPVLNPVWTWPAGRVGGLMDDRGRRDHPGGHRAAQPSRSTRIPTAPRRVRAEVRDAHPGPSVTCPSPSAKQRQQETQTGEQRRPAHDHRSPDEPAKRLRMIEPEFPYETQVLNGPDQRIHDGHDVEEEPLDRRRSGMIRIPAECHVRKATGHRVDDHQTRDRDFVVVHQQPYHQPTAATPRYADVAIPHGSGTQ